MEKEIMRKLHNEDPATWSHEQLSECFPVTPKSVKRIVKSKAKIKPQEIVKYNDKVRENWKLLSKNKLENSEPILEHLTNVGHKIFTDGIDKFISSAQRQELEQKILEDYSASLQPIKPQLTGPFGNILMDHKKKLGKLKDPNDNSNIVEIQNLLNENDDFLQTLGGPNPKLGTTVINAESNTKLDSKNVTVHKFRKEFYNEMKKKAKTSDHAKKYFKWLKTEKNFIETNEKQPPAKLIENVEKEIEPEVKDERKVQKYKDNIVLKSKSKSTELKRNIIIPKDLYKDNAVYQIDDCFYDSNGEFMHRIPGAIPEKN